MTTQALERAIKAIENTVDFRDGWMTPESGERTVRAVLMAVREPPSEVVEAGMIAGGFNGMADLAFTAMIDAILNEDQP